MKKRIKVVGVIPARLKSTRLPEKLLLEIKNKPLVYYTYKNVVASKLTDVIIAVDHKKLYNKLKDLNCNVIMTSHHHKSGTDRVGEIAGKYPADFYLNIQGDEPLLNPSVINHIIDYIQKHPSTEILTVGEKITDKKEVHDPNIVKVVLNKDYQVLYFSRHSIPYNRDNIKGIKYVKHIGLYCYRNDILKRIIKLKHASLEKAEKLEQLRFLENGFKINILLTKTGSVGVDTKQDFLKVKKIIESKA